MIGLYLEIYIESFRTLPILHQTNEEKSLIRLGQCLPTSIRRDKGVSHTPSLLIAPVSEKSFLLYVRAMDHSLGALLAQNINQNHEQEIYYLSRTMIGAEHHYNPIEKECLALVFTVQKM